MRIVRAADPSAGRRWDFLLPDGSRHRDWYGAEALANVLAQHLGQRQAEFETIIEGVDGFGHPNAARIQPGWRGERFDLNEAVRVLFRMRIPEGQTQDAA
ncbi:MAG: hypothetical protein L0H41_17080 [Microlunatus sp.]|nr:hypothetical protein [Microlunatus sp.]